MLPPHLPPITDTDLEVLDALRLERFRSRFGQILLNANLYISGLDRTLIVSGRREVAALRYRQLDLLEQSWHVCACMWVKVYASNELILNLCSSYNKLEDCIRGGSMATAIQEQKDKAIDKDVAAGSPDEFMERNGTQVMERTGISSLPTSKRIIRSLSLTDIAADLEAEETDLQTFLEEHNVTLFEFGGTIIVPETEAITAYEHYSLIRARQKMEERLAAFNAHARAVKPSIEKPSTRNTASKDKPKKNDLIWKGSFKVNKSSYKKTIEAALNALFPNDTDEQQKALADIVQQTDMGKAILDKITRDSAYSDKNHACANLIKAAGELAEASNQSSGEKEEEVETAA